MPDKGISRELTVFRASKRQTDVFQPFGGGFSRIASAFPSQDPPALPVKPSPFLSAKRSAICTAVLTRKSNPGIYVPGCRQLVSVSNKSKI